MAENLFLSLELIYLMNWLLKHEKKRLRGLIKQALNDGLSVQLEKLDRTQVASDMKKDDAFHHVFMGFLHYLEEALLESLERNTKSTNLQNDLALVLQRLNVKNVDLTTMWASLKQAKNELEKQPAAINQREPDTRLMKTVLLEKVLKNWKPGRKEPIN